SVYAHFLMGQAMLRSGDTLGAERELVLVSQLVPRAADVQTWLGLLYQAKHDLPKSRAAFNRAIELEPKSTGVLAGLLSADIAEKKYDAARARIDAALAKSPKDGGLLVLAGNTYVAMNDIPKALSAFDSATQNDPSNLEAFSKHAVLYHS